MKSDLKRDNNRIVYGMQNSIGLKFRHAPAKFAQRVAVLSSSFTSFAFTKYRRAQITLILDLCCFCFLIIIVLLTVPR